MPISKNWRILVPCSASVRNLQQGGSPAVHLSRCRIPPFPHDRGQMALAGEAADVSDLRYRQTAVDKQLLGKGQAPIDEILMRPLAECRGERLDKVTRGKAADGGKLGNRQLA